MNASLVLTKKENATLRLDGIWDYRISKSILSQLQAIKLTNVKINIVLGEHFDLDFCGGGVLLEFVTELESQQRILENQLQQNPKSQKIFKILSTKEIPSSTNLTQNIIKIHSDSFIIIKNNIKTLILSLGFLGEILYTFLASFINFKSIRFKSSFYFF